MAMLDSFLLHLVPLSLEEGPVRRQIIAVWLTAATETAAAAGKKVEESNHHSLGVVLLLHVSRHISLRHEDSRKKGKHTHTLTLGTNANWSMSTGHNSTHTHIATRMVADDFIAAVGTHISLSLTAFPFSRCPFSLSLLLPF